MLAPLVELVEVCRVGPSSPRRRGKLLGEPPPFPEPARVSSLSAMAGGRRRPRAIDPDLIGRLRALLTGLASAGADRQAQPVGRFGRVSRMLRAGSGPAQSCWPRSILSSPISFFRKNLLTFEFKSETCKFNKKISRNPFHLIQNYVSYLFRYLPNGMHPTPFR
jgi:hypothetical protein